MRRWLRPDFDFLEHGVEMQNAHEAGDHERMAREMARFSGEIIRMDKRTLLHDRALLVFVMVLGIGVAIIQSWWPIGWALGALYVWMGYSIGQRVARTRRRIADMERSAKAVLDLLTEQDGE